MLTDLIDKGFIKAILISVVGGFLLRSLLDGKESKTDCKPARPGRDEMTGVDKVYRIPLAPGLQGTLQTLVWMRYLVRRDGRDLHLRRFAERLVMDCRGHGFQCEIDTIFKFVRDEITYRRDPVDTERVQDAKRTLLFRQGDCDDKATLFSSLLATLGHRSCFSLLGTQRNNFSHVFVSVQTQTGWVAYDPTNEKAAPGWQGVAPHVAHFPIF